MVSTQEQESITELRALKLQMPIKGTFSLPSLYASKVVTYGTYILVPTSHNLRKNGQAHIELCIFVYLFHGARQNGK